MECETMSAASVNSQATSARNDVSDQATCARAVEHGGGGPDYRLYACATAAAATSALISAHA
jgi:hypothetical protein